MNKTLTYIVALTLSLPAWAEDAHHPDQQDKPAAAAKAPAKPAPSGAKSPMGGQMGMDCPMHRDGMGMMGKGGMMGGGAEHEAMMARMHQLEKRMDMMQMMMEQMVKPAASAK